MDIQILTNIATHNITETKTVYFYAILPDIAPRKMIARDFNSGGLTLSLKENDKPVIMVYEEPVSNTDKYELLTMLENCEPAPLDQDSA